MVTLKQLSLNKHSESSSPLLAEADNRVCLDIKHGRAESREFFISQRKNFTLSLALLLSCYSAILIPAYFPTKKHIWTDSSTDEVKALLNHSAALLSKPCENGWTKARLQQQQKFHSLLQIPVFLENSTRHWELAPPFGLLGSEETLTQTLRALPYSGLPFTTDRCRRCIVVGSGGVLHGKQLGTHIDKYDVIIRMNNAPVIGFENDAGSKTTIRLMYPEGAPYLAQDYQNTDIVAVVVFKQLDLKWLSSVVTKQQLSWWSKLWFWRDVVNEIPLQPKDIRILNPEILSKTGNMLQAYIKQQRKMVPTLGITGVVLALQLCDEVNLAGFGYDLKHPGALLHYYGTVRMDHMMAQVVHDVNAEGSLLRDLLKAKVIHDVTGAL